MGCGVCGNSAGNRTIVAREMMFGTRERFEYEECGACGTLQLKDPPRDLSPWYPPEYYAHQVPSPLPVKLQPLRRLRTELALRGLPFFPRGRPAWLDWLRGLSTCASILDIGCGNGTLLLNLAQEGFRDLVGTDPYLSDELERPGLRLLKADLRDLDGSFDVAMFHHSFEHLSDPHATFDEVRRLAQRVIIRIPVPAWAWRFYRADWASLDPPRHLYLFTPGAMRQLAGAHGFVVTRVTYDSTAFQFIASEKYRRDLPLHEVGGQTELFTQDEIVWFERRATLLNEIGEGDTACFQLERVAP